MSSRRDGRSDARPPVRSVLLLVGLVLPLGAGIATYVAGELGELVILRTRDESGRAHETKLWIIDLGGRPWLRVARPGRSWFERLRTNPRVELERNGSAQAYRATPILADDRRAQVNARFREKYGLVDWWYGVLLRRNPIPVRLDPEPPG